MSMKTLRIVSGITTAVAAAAVSIVTLLGVPNQAAVTGIIVAVAGAVDEVCSLFVKESSEAGK